MTLYLILTPNRERLLIWAVFLILAAILMFRAFIWIEYYLPNIGRINTIAMIEGTAHRPFVYRVLIPKLTGAIHAGLPEETQPQLASFARWVLTGYSSITGDTKVLNTSNRDDYFLSLSVVQSLLIFLCLMGYGVVLYKLGRLLFPHSHAARFFATLIGYGILPVGAMQATHVYDTPVLLLTAWCFFAMMTARWRSYLLLFLLACLNKETSYYIVVMYIFCAYGRPEYNRILLWQILIWITTTGLIHFHYAINPGGVFEFYLPGNALALTFHLYASQLMALLTGIFLLLYSWEEKPLPLRQASMIIVPAMLLWIVLGLSQELRALYDIFPILTLLLTHTLVVATGIDRGRIFKNA